jgi:hypothetical protein
MIVNSYLLSLNLFGIEVVGFSYIKVRGNFVVAHGLEHALLHEDLVVESLVFSLLKVVHYGNFRRVIFQHQLGGH